ncbi:MAG TPA: spermidine/putrescine ABC transporter substrate-binding protein [Deltaproteobacteria bacterium]|jgi:spermidine/putrescine transport system substrate-binding protein|nr:spermidine/putrescine ABC transporter substrate-binding protein [Deltaproteobacteria bacterium]HOI08193.1 spermidine/putrescine ABC transporter substrate-binding protein [Deltaproteobacteria bacterium]
MKRFAVLLMVLLFPLAAFGAKNEVYVFNWSEYIDPAVLTSFEKETGIKVRYSTYESNESMFAKLKIIRKNGYDVAFPSTYFVERMRKLNMLKPLDRARLTNLKHTDPKLLNKPYDPNNVYSVPYLWGSSAIGVNAKYIKPSSVKSFDDLWSPAYKGKLLLMDDMRDVFAMSLRSLGYSGNDTNPEHIKAAYLKLLKLKPGVKVFNSDSPKQPFLNNEVTIGQIWGGEIYQAAQENPNLVYIYPREGATFWVDSMVIPSSARNIGNAHAFINYMLRPDIARKNCEYVGYATPNLTAKAMLDPKTRNNKAVYPDAADFDRGEFQADVGKAIDLYAKYWEMLKTR